MPGILSVGTSTVTGGPVPSTPGIGAPGLAPTIIDNGDGTSTVFTVTAIGATTGSTSTITQTGSAVIESNGNVTLTGGSVTNSSSTTTFDTATSFLVDNASGLPLPVPPTIDVQGTYDSVTGIFTPGLTPANTVTTGPTTTSTGGANLTMDGNLSVAGTSTTNGITNNGSIITTSLTDGTVTLTGGTLLNTANHGLEITDNGTILSGGQSASPTSGVLTLNASPYTHLVG